MVDAYLVRSLKRVHDQAAETLEVKEPTSSETIAERFNQILSDFQEEYPDNERLHRIEPIEGTTASLTRAHTVEAANEDLREIKLGTEQIADLFDLDVADFEEVDEATEMRPIGSVEILRDLHICRIIRRDEGPPEVADPPVY